MVFFFILQLPLLSWYTVAVDQLKPFLKECSVQAFNFPFVILEDIQT